MAKFIQLTNRSSGIKNEKIYINFDLVTDFWRYGKADTLVTVSTVERVRQIFVKETPEEIMKLLGGAE